ncbi:MAG: hypothetical protein ACKV2Q_26035 [Planctomycetaceae bacterium]
MINHARRVQQLLSRILTLSSVVFLASLLGVSSAFASGEIFSLTGHDLQVDVDSRWAGGGQGGYCPVRVRVVNRGPARRLTFRIGKSSDQVVAVRQTVDVPQNGTLGLTLSVPLVNGSTNGEFRVADAGGDLETLRRNVSFPEINSWEMGHPGLVVVSSGVVNLQPFEDGVTTFRHVGVAGGGMASHHGYRGTNSVWLPKGSLPSSWVDYSGLDLLAVPLATLAQLPKETRAALTQWTRCGGTLLVTAIGDSSTAHESLAKSLVDDAAAASAWVWTEPTQNDRQTPQIVSLNPGTGGFSVEMPSEDIEPGEWPRETVAFRMTNFGFGKLIAFQGDPFPGTAQDWFWLLKASGGVARWDWGKRHGLSARQGNSDFLMFLIPGIGGVPVIVFLVLITIFSVVIGPLNYFVLARRKKLHLLLLTIPAVAIVTTVLLFGYTVVAHGFSVKARCRSLTLIDQSAKSAVTFNRLSLYAGQAPSGGMQFSRDTAVYPIWQEYQEFESGQLDWTDKQTLTSGFLRSRTRTQFLTVGHRTERGRLEVTSSGSEKLTVANGYEWGFAPLVVTNDQGELFVGKSVAAGDSIELQRATEEQLRDVVAELQRHPLELPVGLTGVYSSGQYFGPSPRAMHARMYWENAGNVSWHYHESLMEQAWQRLRSGSVAPSQLASEQTTVPRTFYGLATQTPHIELGVPKATEINSVHLVMGRW